MTVKTTQKIYDILFSNGIKVNKRFARLMEMGYGSDSCQELSDEIVALLRNIAENGVNGKFDRQMKETAIDLADIASDLSDKNAPKKFTKLREKVDALKRNACVSAPVYEQNAMHSTVKTYFRESIRGAEAMMGQTDDLTQQGYLADAIRELKAMETKFDEGVWDLTSSLALAKEKKIVAEFIEWRRKVNARMINEYTMEHIKNISTAIDEWSTSLGVTRANPKAKADEVALYEEDTLSHVTVSTETYSNARTFFKAMDMYSRQTETICSTAELDEKRAEIVKKIQECDASLTAIAGRIMNGEDPVRLFSEKTRIDQNKERYSEQLERVDEKISLKLASRADREETVFRIERIRDVFELSEHSPSLIYSLFHNTDFAQLASLLDPSADPSTLRDSIRNLYEVFTRQQIIDKNGSIQREQLKKLEGMIKEQSPQKKVEIETKTAEKKKEQDAIAEQMRKWAMEQAKVAPAPTTTTATTEEQKTEVQTDIVSTLLSSNDN